MTTLEDEAGMPAPLPVAAAPMRAAPPKPLANAIWNWFGLGVEVAIALLLMPFLIHRLGEAAYGAWIIIGSLTGYLGNLDFGMLSSVGRHLALCHARNDRNGILDVINSAGFAQAMIGMLGLSIVVLISHFLGSITAIPEELLVEAQLALLIGGANLAFSLFLKLFDSALWSNQRFDLLNMVDISAAALRFVLAVTVVSQGYGLVGLACVSFSLTILVGAAKWCLTRFVDREIRFSRAHVRLTTLRKLWSFGVWNTVGSVAGMARSQLSPVVVGATLGVSMVTPYSVVVRLIGMATQFMGAGTGVLVPFSTGLHARNEGHNQQRLFHEASKLCVAAAFYFYALFALLGQSLLTIWIGPELALAWVPLVILASGELIPMSLSMAQVIFLATARNRPAALRSVVECALAISLACVLWRPLGLNGVCLALAVSAALCRGVFGLVQATQIIGISAWEFLTQTFFPVAVAVLPAVGLLALATWDRMPESWPMLFLYTGVFSAIYWISSLLTVFGWSHLRRIIVDR